MSFEHISYDGKNQQQAEQQGAMVPLSYIVSSVQNELRDYGMGFRKYLLQLAIDGLRELRLYDQVSLSVIYITPNDAGIVKFPSDYIDYVKIGIPINGQLYNLTVNDNMLLNRATRCGIDVRQISAGTVPGIEAGYFYTPHYNSYGNYVGSLYGVGGGFNIAYFRIDQTAGQIQFDGAILDREIVMEYKSSGIGPGTIIAPQCIAPLKAYVQWKRVAYDDRVAAGVKQMRKDEYQEATTKMRMFNQMFTTQEYYDLMYSNHKQTPKW